MSTHTEEIISVSVAAHIQKLPVVLKVTQEVAKQCGLEKEKRLKLTLAVEEIFHYCVKLLKPVENPSRITLTYLEDFPALQIQIEYKGPRGVLEKHFIPGNPKSFKLLSFEAVGLHLAQGSIDDLQYGTFYDGTNRFTITMNVPPPGAASKGVRRAPHQPARPPKPTKGGPPEDGLSGDAPLGDAVSDDAPLEDATGSWLDDSLEVLPPEDGEPEDPAEAPPPEAAPKGPANAASPGPSEDKPKKRP